jgi:hypothetical protein
MKGVSQRYGIRALVASQPAASNKHVNLDVQEFDHDAPQALSLALTVQGHALGAGRSDPDLGRAIVRRVGHGTTSDNGFAPRAPDVPRPVTTAGRSVIGHALDTSPYGPFWLTQKVSVAIKT